MSIVTIDMTKQFFDALSHTMKDIDPQMRDIKTSEHRPNAIWGVIDSNNSFLQFGEDMMDVIIDIDQDKAFVNFASYEGITTYKTPVFDIGNYKSPIDFFNAVAERIVSSTRAEFRASEVTAGMKLNCS